MTEHLCIECFNELDDDDSGERCLACEEGVGTWPWEDTWADFEEMSLDDLEDDETYTDEEEE